ncbi:MAG: DUF4360 domain-containing protein [Devosia sp.]
MRAWLLVLAIIAISLPAHAQSGLSLGRASYGGTGCPAGTATVALSLDKKRLSLRFDRYEVAAGGGTGRTFDRKSCNLAIPLGVPSGISVSVIAIEYRGVNRLPAGAKAQFRVESFFAGGQGPVLTRVFNGPLRGRFSFADTMTAKSAIWSACGADVILRTNTSLRVTTTAKSAAVSSIKSQEIRTAIVYRLQWRNC